MPGFVSGAGAPSATPGHFFTQKAKRIALRLLCKKMVERLLQNSKGLYNLSNIRMTIIGFHFPVLQKSQDVVVQLYRE